LKLKEETGTSWEFLERIREEWAVVDLACAISDITIVPFFDSLGAEALSFVLNQTEVTTMCCEK